MRRVAYAVYLTLILTTTIWSQGTDFSELTPYQVSRIVDGDTVVLLVDGAPVKVRLIGVDTPETVHPQKPVEYYGKEASTFTKNLLRGESVYLVYGQERLDRYGRTLGYLYRAPDGLFVNAEIIRQGYGHAYTKYPFREDLMEEFRGLQKHAMDAGKGLWAGTQTSVVSQPISPSKAIPPKALVSEPTAHQHTTVYVTKSGTKYHADGCRYLKKSKKSLPLVEARLKYSACKVCKPPR
jgi:micrococcal nuclease